MGTTDDIATRGLSDADKAEYELLKQQLFADGETPENIRAILGSFVCDCMEPQ